MRLDATIKGALIGSLTLNLLHEGVKRVNPNAPRMDLLGMEALSKQLNKKDINLSENNLFAATLAGDLVSNALYYSLAGIGEKKNVILRGALLGLAAGIGAVLLPKPMHLNPSRSSRTNETVALTILWYTIGGIASAAAMKLLDKPKIKNLH